MKVLVGYFGPYLSVSENIGEKVARGLKGITVQKFPVCFDEKIFLNPLKERHDLYIVLGHNPSGKKIQLECVGKNLRMGLKGTLSDRLLLLYMALLRKFGRNFRAKPSFKERTILRPIDPNGPDEVKIEFQPPIPKSWVRSSDAGTYVCNFCTYVVGRTRERFCFIHIPGRYDPKLASEEVQSFIQNAMS